MTSWNPFRLVGFHQQTIAAPPTSDTGLSAITNESWLPIIYARLVSTLRGWAQQGGFPREDWGLIQGGFTEMFRELI
jgi:hypothetical protein